MISFAGKSSLFIARLLTEGVLFLGLLSTAHADLITGLVAYYPFDGNASDMSVNGNHGEVNGASLGSDRHGVEGTAYSFDGLDDYVSALDNNYSTPNYSISFWLKANDLEANQYVIEQYITGSVR